LQLLLGLVATGDVLNVILGAFEQHRPWSCRTLSAGAPARLHLAQHETAHAPNQDQRQPVSSADTQFKPALRTSISTPGRLPHPVGKIGAVADDFVRNALNGRSWLPMRIDASVFSRRDAALDI